MPKLCNFQSLERSKFNFQQLGLAVKKKLGALQKIV
ncbi:hypothetical protein X749_21990 [Mesorhizobium sp. LNJC391B00]|nr:hypothetical protein X749_21990 [Mesorhizobium sp. LNJC391B00]